VLGLVIHDSTKHSEKSRKPEQETKEYYQIPLSKWISKEVTKITVEHFYGNFFVFLYY